MIITIPPASLLSFKLASLELMLGFILALHSDVLSHRRRILCEKPSARGQCVQNADLKALALATIVPASRVKRGGRSLLIRAEDLTFGAIVLAHVALAASGPDLKLHESQSGTVWPVASSLHCFSLLTIASKRR
jgi:hypothetical protein